jgi:hypothetical protein
LQTIQTVIRISHVSGTDKIGWDIDIDINFSQAVQEVLAGWAAERVALGVPDTVPAFKPRLL